MQPGTEPGSEKWVRYFDRPGPANTRETLECCRRRAPELGIKTVVVASLRGASASLAVELFAGSGLKIVAVTIPREHSGSYSLTNDLWEDIPELRRQKEEWVEAGLERIRMDMDEETESRLEAQGVSVVRGCRWNVDGAGYGGSDEAFHQPDLLRPPSRAGDTGDHRSAAR